MRTVRRPLLCPLLSAKPSGLSVELAKAERDVSEAEQHADAFKRETERSAASDARRHSAQLHSVAKAISREKARKLAARNELGRIQRTEGKKAAAREAAAAARAEAEAAAAAEAEANEAEAALRAEVEAARELGARREAERAEIEARSARDRGEVEATLAAAAERERALRLELGMLITHPN